MSDLVISLKPTVSIRRTFVSLYLKLHCVVCSAHGLPLIGNNGSPARKLPAVLFPPPEGPSNRKTDSFNSSPTVLDAIVTVVLNATAQ